MNTQNIVTPRKIFKDPQYYYLYYDDRYISALRALKTLQQSDSSPASTIGTQILLANLCAKKAILKCYMNDEKSHDRMQQLWEQIEEVKQNIPYTYKGLKEYESLVKNIIMECEKKPVV